MIFGNCSSSLAAFLRELRLQLKQTQMAAFADGTVDNLSRQWKKYLLFCSLVDSKPLPISPTKLCVYLQFLANTMKSPATVRAYLSGLKTLCLLLNLPVGSFLSL